jgi:hypothetical protein
LSHQASIQKVGFQLGATACNPSYSGGTDQEVQSQLQAKSSRHPILKKKKNHHTQKKKKLVEWLKQ